MAYKNKNDYKKIKKKRNYFRNQCKNKYFINDNSLYYKYNDNEKTKNLKIPYKTEKDIILKNIHINIKYPSRHNMRELVKPSSFYWEGFTSDIKSLINNCPICTSTKKFNKNKSSY